MREGLLTFGRARQARKENAHGSQGSVRVGSVPTRDRWQIANRRPALADCLLLSRVSVHAYSCHVDLDTLLNRPNAFEIKLNTFRIKTNPFHASLETLQNTLV